MRLCIGKTEQVLYSVKMAEEQHLLLFLEKTFISVGTYSGIIQDHLDLLCIGKMINRLYDTSLGLLTDLYQLTMAYGYWKSGKAEQEAVFNLYFRKHPFQGGFTIACGLSSVIDYLNEYRFDEEDLEYVGSLTGSDGQKLFEPGFLDYLRSMELQCSVDAVPEGTVVFPNEPLLRIQGPILQCQLLETPLLNLINFQSLIATKAARMRLVAKDDSLLEFG